MSVPVTRAQFAPIQAFVIAQRGQTDSFTMVLPGHKQPQGLATGSPLVNGAGQSGTSLVTDGWSSGATTLVKGTVFTIDGVYATNPLEQSLSMGRLMQFSINASVTLNTSATLTFTPAPNAFGSAQVSVVLMDDGSSVRNGRKITSVF